MDRTQLISKLNAYTTSFPEEQIFVPRFKSLLTNFEDCYNRSLLTGHMTASAWIINQTGDYALLVHHKKLNRWLQPGGHADGDENIIDVAFREAEEETGLESIELINDDIFDIDIHLIPAHKNVKAHFHHDIRFLFTADQSEPYEVSHESNELAWIDLKEIKRFVGDNDSILRMVLKTNEIFEEQRYPNFA